MKKFLIGLLFITSSLFAEYSQNRVVSVTSFVEENNILYRLDDWINNNYAWALETLPAPVEYTGYLWQQNALSATTNSVHSIYSSELSIFIDVYIFNNSTEYSQVYEASLYELDNGNNERVIDNGLTVSQYKIDEITYSNGDKLVRYQIPDSSSDTKRVRVTTCSKWLNPTQEWCTHTLTYITGTAPSS